MGEVVREKKLLYKIECWLVSALRLQLKRPAAFVAEITGFNKKEITNRAKKITSLEDCFEQWFSEEIMEAAKRIKNKKTYEQEKRQLYKILIPVGENEMCEEAVNSAYKRLYAEKMAVVWNKLNSGEEALIYQFKPELLAAKRLEGNFVKILKENLPKDLQDITLPVLVLAYDKNKMEILGDKLQIASVYIRNIPVPKNGGMPGPLETISWNEAYSDCWEYFTRNGYDMHQDLLEQITTRATKELIPLSIMRREAHITARVATLD